MNIRFPKLLITDDDRSLRDTLSGLFQARGFDVVLAADGHQAVELATSQEPHLALMDLHLPGINGLDAVRRVWRDHLEQPDRSLPCIMISALWDEATLSQAQSLSVYSTLSKPISVREITDTVNQAMRHFYDWPGNN